MSGAIPLLPQYASMVLCSVKAQGQLYLYGFLEECLKHGEQENENVVDLEKKRIISESL
jgi:hypothetical protein